MTTLHWARALAPFALFACAGCVVSLPTGSGGGETTGASSGTSQANGTTGSGMPCGKATCNPATEYCGFAPGTCDGDKACRPYVDDCTHDNAACGCDNKNYAGACTALHNSGGIVGAGACVAPAGQFNCTYATQAPITCTTATQYCKIKPGGGLYGLECVDLPAVCTGVGATCQCQDGTFQQCGQNFCAADAGALTVLCP